LAIDAVEITGLIEHSKVSVAIFWSFFQGELWITSTTSSRAAPIGNTVGWEGIMVK